MRTTTDAPTTIKATGDVVPDRFREFFILRQVDDAWKIDRYMNNRPA